MARRATSTSYDANFQFSDLHCNHSGERVEIVPRFFKTVLTDFCESKARRIDVDHLVTLHIFNCFKPDKKLLAVPKKHRDYDRHPKIDTAFTPSNFPSLHFSIEVDFSHGC